jgi:AbrB family looped-hinge helix DNA binding protein
MKTETIQIDKAGRLVLPKPLRKKFNLEAGDKLRLSVEGNSIRLEPTDPAGKLVRKGGVLVFTGEFSEPLTTETVNSLIEDEREKRTAEHSRGFRKR